MAVRNVFEIVADGDQLNEGYFNGIFNAMPKLMQNYTGTGFNSSASGAGDTDTQDHEMTAIAAADLVGKTYVRVTVSGTYKAVGDATNNAYVQFKVQTKEVGGSYADSLTYKDMLRNEVGGASGEQITKSDSFIYLHTLTAGEITNGVQVKVFSNSVNGGSANNLANFVNINTTIELIS